MSEVVADSPHAGFMPPSTPSRPLSLMIASAVLIIGLLVALLLFLNGSSERPLKVRLALFDVDGSSDCSGGSGGYSDVGPGMPITVKDQDGKLIGSSSLPSDGEDLNGLGCVWETVVMVPDAAQQYAVEGGSRGAVTFSLDKLQNEENWTAELSLGM
jgi:hypothetical protein